MTDNTAEVLEPVREIPKIRQECIRIQDQTGLCYRGFKVVLPQGLVRQDLHDYPEIWKLTQSGRNTSLISDDRLYIVASDRSWAADYVVISADHRGVKLNAGNLLWSGKEHELGIVWEDENYEVEWAGFGYSIYQKAKGNRSRTMVEGGFLTTALAKSAVGQKYPRGLE